MLNGLNPAEYRTLIENYALKLQNLLMSGQKTKAMALLKEIQSKYDTDEDLDYVISVIVEVLDNVMTEQPQAFPRTLPPKKLFTHEEKDSLMSQLLDMKVIWISDLENFSEAIRCTGALSKYPKIMDTKGYALYDAMRTLDTKKVGSLLDEYFASPEDEQYKIELASRMLEQMLIKWHPAFPITSSVEKTEPKRDIIKALLEKGAQVSNHPLLSAFDKNNDLTDLANARKSKYVYRVG